MTTKLLSPFQECNPRVLIVFDKLVSKCDEEKRSKIVYHAAMLVKEGKKPERALADALDLFQLGGRVS